MAESSDSKKIFLYQTDEKWVLRRAGYTNYFASRRLKKEAQQLSKRFKQMGWEIVDN